MLMVNSMLLPKSVSVVVCAHEIVLTGTLFTFAGKDNYNKLGTAFTTLWGCHSTLRRSWH